MFWKLLLSWMVLGFFALAAAARAQAVIPPAGPELVVNTFTLGAQFNPALAVRADDAFVAAWVEGGALTGGVKARLFDPTGAPTSPEIWVDQSGVPGGGGLRIGCAVDGGFAVAWSDGQDVWVRRFDRGGVPLGAKLRVNDPGLKNFLPDLAMAPGGAFVVAWQQDGPGGNDVVLAARFDNQGGRTGTPFQVSSGSQTPLLTPRLAIAVDGGFVAAWEADNQILARRFGALGALAPPVRLDGPQADQGVGLAPPLLRPDGTATVIWVSSRGILARRLDATGAPLGDASLISAKTLGTPLATAADATGNLVVAGGSFQVMGILFDPNLVQESDLFLLGNNYPPESEPVLAARYSGGFVAMWTSGTTPTFPYPGVPVVVGADGDSLGVAGQLFGPPRCLPGSDRLCLGPGGRFEAAVSWKNPSTGDTGAAHPMHLTQDTGAFWFFSADSLELMVKVVNGTGLNGHVWVYTGALSNLEYTLTVTDTVTGAERVYYNPPSQFGNVADVNAFAIPGFATPVALPPPPVLQQVPLGGCQNQGSLPRSLCFQNGRFTAVVDFKNPLTGATASAVSVSLTQDTGVFWFFDDTNLELMVKLLDGRSVNGRFWFFYGALSDIEYTITVYDSQTGGSRTYHNPPGTLASGADISAF